MGVGGGGGGGGDDGGCCWKGVQGVSRKAEISVAMETIVFPSPVIGAAVLCKYLLFL